MNVYETITEKMIKLLEQDVIPWRPSWNNSAMLGEHQNLLTSHKYRGWNAFSTAMQGYQDAFWLTYNQGDSIGCHVKKGEKGTSIINWQFNKTTNAQGEEKESAFMKHYTIFNIAQFENVSEKLQSLIAKRRGKALDFNPIEACETLVNGYSNRPKIEHREQRAYYWPTADSINMPQKESFESAEKYYATLFHELTHSTGHGTRLARIGITDRAKFASHEYSKEELIAEMGSAFLCAKSGIEASTINDAASYIKGWLKVLKGEPKMIIQAASAAQKAVDLIINKKEEKETE